MTIPFDDACVGLRTSEMQAAPRPPALAPTIRRRAYLAHRLAWFYVTGRWDNRDDREGDPNNNRRSNLRCRRPTPARAPRKATSSQNCANKRRQQNNTSGFKGVVAYRGRWRAMITKNGRSTMLGPFETPAAAHAAYAAAARKLFGEFARAE